MNALFGAFVGSILFGMAALTTRGLAVPIGVHAAWNFGEWIVGEKEIPGLWKPVIPGGHSATADHITRQRTCWYSALRRWVSGGTAAQP